MNTIKLVYPNGLNQTLHDAKPGDIVKIEFGEYVKLGEETEPTSHTNTAFTLMPLGGYLVPVSSSLYADLRRYIGRKYETEHEANKNDVWGISAYLIKDSNAPVHLLVWQWFYATGKKPAKGQGFAHSALLDEYQRHVEANEVPTKKRLERFCENLHGSGIDASWDIDETRNFFYARNSFHCMNEHGYYEGWQDFSIRFKKGETMRNFVMQYNNGSYLGRKHYLKDDLHDVILFTITDDVFDFDED